jgi:tetratricopeptide (TPR) repeat protein
LLISLALTLVACAEQSVLQDAVLLARRGEEGKAIVLLQGYLHDHPSAISERRLLLRLHAASGDLQAAQGDAAALARTLGVDSPVPWLELGYALELAHRYEEALQMYDKASAVAPHDPAGPRVGGLRAARWGQLDWAADRLTEALRRDSRAVDVWHALGVVELARGDLGEAQRAYESGLLAAPDSAENHLGLASIAVEQGNFALALLHYDAIARLRPRLASAQLGRSYMLIQLGRDAEARQALARAQVLGADPHVVRAQLNALIGERVNPSPTTQKPSENR